MKRINYIALFCMTFAVVLAACVDTKIVAPEGPQGEKGDTGLSAYELWKDAVADGTLVWNKDQVGVADFFKYLRGKDGKNGVDGVKGKDAYEQWKEMVAAGTDHPLKLGEQWPAEENSMSDFWRFLTGATGETGQTPHIGSNGHWFIGKEDTGIPVTGKDGKPGQDAVAPEVSVGANGNWWIDGEDSGRPAIGEKGDQGRQGDRGQQGDPGKDGKDAVAPAITIDSSGYWLIDGKPTGKKAVAKDGSAPSVAINDKGNWVINGKDTNVSAYGAKGDKGNTGAQGDPGKNGADGRPGKSAYELWKDLIASGTADDPHNNGKKWPASKNTLADFWSYLSGK